MKPNPSMIMISSLIFTTLPLLLQTFPTCFCKHDHQYRTCKQPFQCGNITDIGYPFWGGDRPLSCGHPGFEISCEDGVAEIQVATLLYRVLAIHSQVQTLQLSRVDLWQNLCPKHLQNTTLNFTLFKFYKPANDQIVTLYYDCPVEKLPVFLSRYRFDCGIHKNFFSTMDESDLENGSTCGMKIVVPVNQTLAQSLLSTTAHSYLLQDALKSGFSVQWLADNDKCKNCQGTGGLCGYNQDGRSFICYCADRAQAFTCNGTHPINAIILGIAGMILSSLIIFYITKQNRKSKLDKLHGENVDNVLLNYGSLAPRRYSNSEIKKMTKSFSDELGHGGYGIVYRGWLPDGQVVAVKVLTRTNGNGEEFINEVVSISRTSHVNIVNLLGYCLDGKRRALVYEYMPNASLDKFIDRRGQTEWLQWNKLYDIATGVARGLEYLHSGCNSRIIHFDIKPQNILLDEDFCPKISDFGLAKMFNKKESELSQLSTRGTIGYISPEVFCRSFGAVSHKSDVYSYGMVLLEMIGATKFHKPEETESSEKYFPDRIYDMALNNKLDDLIREEYKETAQKMLLVGLWCIQAAPSDRPTMTKVVEMLGGSLQFIPFPPMPSLSTKLSAPQFSSPFSVYVETESSSSI